MQGGGFSKESNQKNAQGKEKQGVYFPLLISYAKQLSSKSDGGNFTIKGLKVEKIIFIGRLTYYNNDPKVKSKISFLLNDSTGSLEFIANKIPHEEKPPIFKDIEIRTDMYLKVICTPKVINGDEQVYIADHIEEVKDYNLLSNHILCFIHAMLSVDRDVKHEVLEAGAHQEGVAATTSMQKEQGRVIMTKFIQIIRDSHREDNVSLDQIKRLARQYSITDGEVTHFIQELVEAGEMVTNHINSQCFYQLA